MNPPKIIKQHFKELTALCEKYGVEKLYAFGSVVTDRFNPETSDIDLIVELESMPPLQAGGNLIKLWSALEDLFARKVDLISNYAAIKNPYLKKSLEATKQLIYERQSEEIFKLDLLPFGYFLFK
jgi:predicted nucleotidyltransferase